MQFTSLRNILISPLPRAYEVGQNGAPVPLEEEPRAIGLNVDIDKVTGSAQDMKRRLETEVIQPVQEWMVAYRTIQVRGRLGWSLRRSSRTEDNKRSGWGSCHCMLHRLFCYHRMANVSLL